MIGQRQFWGHSRSNPPLIILLAIFSSALFLLVLLIASVSHDDFVGLQNEDTSLSPVKKCGGIGGKKSSFYCCAHRGARILAPENTLSSFLKAIEVNPTNAYWCFEPLARLSILRLERIALSLISTELQMGLLW